MRASLVTTTALLWLALTASTRAQTPGPVEAPAAVASPCVAATTSRAPARYDLFLSNGSPFIELAVGNARGLFLVDTAATSSAIDEEWVEKEKLPYERVGKARVTGTTGSASFTVATLERLDLGNGFFLSPRFNLQNISKRFGKVEGRRRVGRLGTEHLGAFALTFDWEGRKLDVAFRDERPAPPPGEKTVPLSWPKNIPTVTAKLGGLEVDCRLDTGASYIERRAFLDVGPPVVAALKKKGVKLREIDRIRMKGVTGTDELAVLESEPPLTLTIGPARVEGVVLVVHEDGTLARKTPLVLAGMPILRRLGKKLGFDPFDRVLRMFPD